jgi:hypothetical protein
VTEFSNISGNPDEPVVLIGDDPDHEGHVLISRLPVPESLPSDEVFAVKAPSDETSDTETGEATKQPGSATDESTHDDAVAQPGDAAGTDAPSAAPSGASGQ